jgi:hypothetical protein
MAYSDKLMDHYENPRNVGSMDKDDHNVGTGMVGAPACGHRVEFAGHRMAEGQNAGPGTGDKEHRHLGRIGATAGEDTLLDIGRGRDQGGGG